MDWSLFVLNLRFTLNHRAVRELGVEPHILECGREDPTPNVEDGRRFNDCPLEAAGDLGQRGDEQVAQGVSIELGTGLVESVLKESRHQRFIVGERDKTVPNIAWSRNVVGGADLACAAAVICHRYDRGNGDVVALQTAQQRREAGSAADGDHIDLGPAQAETMFGDYL